MKVLLENALEILQEAQGEWLSVIESRCPDSIIPLKNACFLIEQALSCLDSP